METFFPLLKSFVCLFFFFFSLVFELTLNNFSMWLLVFIKLYTVRRFSTVSFWLASKGINIHKTSPLTLGQRRAVSPNVTPLATARWYILYWTPWNQIRTIQDLRSPPRKIIIIIKKPIHVWSLSEHVHPLWSALVGLGVTSTAHPPPTSRPKGCALSFFSLFFLSGGLCDFRYRTRRLIRPQFYQVLFASPVIYHRGKADNHAIEILLLPPLCSLLS